MGEKTRSSSQAAAPIVRILWLDRASLRQVYRIQCERPHQCQGLPSEICAWTALCLSHFSSEASFSFHFQRITQWRKWIEYHWMSCKGCHFTVFMAFSFISIYDSLYFQAGFPLSTLVIFPPVIVYNSEWTLDQCSIVKQTLIPVYCFIWDTTRCHNWSDSSNQMNNIKSRLHIVVQQAIVIWNGCQI